MFISLLASITIFSFLLLVRAESAFIVPPINGLNVTPESKVNIRWTTDWGAVPITLTLYQSDPGSTNSWQSATLLDQVLDPGSYIWVAKTIYNLPTTHGFHFSIMNGTNETTSVNSGALFITDDTSSTSTAATSSTSLPSNPSTASPSQNATTSATAKNGLSSGAKAGIGIGVPLGVIAAVAIGGYIWWVRKRRSATVGRAELGPKDLPSKSQPSEVHGKSIPSEADGIPRSELE